jgi:tetratricopeptide (TPR) repeat protein
MKKISWIVLLVLIVTFFTGCPDWFNFPKPPGDDVTTTLAEEVLDEVVAGFAAPAAAARAVSAEISLNSAQRDALRDYAWARLASLSSAQQNQLDAIMPVLMAAVSGYALENRAQLAIALGDSGDLVYSKIVSRAAAVAAEAAAKEGRQEKVSDSSVTVQLVISNIAASAVQEILDNLNSDQAEEVALEMLLGEVTRAVDRCDTIDDNEAGEAITSIVSASVSAVVAHSDGDSSDAATIVATIVVSASALENISVEDLAALPEDCAAEAVAAAAEDGDADLDAYAAEIAAEASQAAAVSGYTLNAASFVASIEAALEAAEASVDVDIDLVVGEVPPTINAYGLANGSETPKATIQLSAAPSSLRFFVNAAPGGTAEAINISWIQQSGPGRLALQNSNDFTLTDLEGFIPGLYIIEVRVTNVGGYKSASAFMQINCTYNISASAASVNAGLNALKDRNYDYAYQQFQLALSQDPNNKDAKLWAALLKTCSLTVDPAVVSVARDTLGILDYPEDMATLFTDTWFSVDQFVEGDLHSQRLEANSLGTYVKLGLVTDFINGEQVYYYRDIPGMQLDTFGYFVPLSDPSEDGVYVYYTNWVPTFNGESIVGMNATELYANAAPYRYALVDDTYYDNFIPVAFPRIAITPEAQDFIDAAYLGNFNRADVGGKNLFESFPIALIFNVLANAPQGLNQTVDALLAGPFAQVNGILALLDGLEPTDEIAVPIDLIEAYAGQDIPEEAEAAFAALAVISGNEIRAFGAQLLMFKSVFELIAAYDLDYPIGGLVSMVASIESWYEAEHEIVPAYDTNVNGVPDPVEAFMAANPNPFKEMMSVRSVSRLAQAKADMIGYLNRLVAAAEAEKADIQKILDLGLMPPMEGMTPEEVVALYSDMLDNCIAYEEAIIGALNNDTTISLNPDLFSDGMPPELFAPDFDWTGSFTYKPSAVYSTNAQGLGFFSPALFFRRTQTGGFLTNLILEMDDGWDDDDPENEAEDVSLKGVLGSTGFTKADAIAALDQIVPAEDNPYVHLSAHICLEVSNEWITFGGFTASEITFRDFLIGGFSCDSRSGDSFDLAAAKAENGKEWDGTMVLVNFMTK